jgi:serine/threonine protein kinase
MSRRDDTRVIIQPGYKSMPDPTSDQPMARPPDLSLMPLASEVPTQSYNPEQLKAVAAILAASHAEKPSAVPPPPVNIEGYAILNEIARGGQGAVYEGIRNSTGRRVAVKVLIGGAFIGQNEKARFEREVKILAALDHPNIVGVIDRGLTADGSLFLVMDFITGPPLDQYLHSYYHMHPEGPPPADPSELLRLFMKICGAINAAHVQGIVHRDIKPSNIRITDGGEPFILDFGLARSPLSSTGSDGDAVSMTGQFLGTLAWASPEQAEGSTSKIDCRTDVYSLGLILYQMLTRSFPYEVVGTIRDVLNNIINSAPTPPSKMVLSRGQKSANGKRRLHVKSNGNINPVLESIILKALSKDRAARYQTAGEFAKDMANYLSGQPTIAIGKQASIWQRQGRKTVIAIAAIAAVACITPGIWLLMRTVGPSATPVSTKTTSSEPTLLAIPTDKVLLEDDFSGSSLDPMKWTAQRASLKPAGSSVTVADGVVTISQDQTNNGGFLISRPLTFAPTGLITIKDRAYIHVNGTAGSVNYYGGTSLRNPNNWNQQFGVAHVNVPGFHTFSFGDDGKFAGFNSPNLGDDVSSNTVGFTGYGGGSNFGQVGAVWDTWYTETITLDPATRVVTYSVNGAPAITGMLSAPLPQGPMNLVYNSYGWGTGHFEKIDSVSVTQAKATENNDRLTPQALGGRSP